MQMSVFFQKGFGTKSYDLFILDVIAVLTAQVILWQLAHPHVCKYILLVLLGSEGIQTILQKSITCGYIPVITYTDLLPGEKD